MGRKVLLAFAVSPTVGCMLQNSQNTTGFSPNQSIRSFKVSLFTVCFDIPATHVGITECQDAKIRIGHVSLLRGHLTAPPALTWRKNSKARQSSCPQFTDFPTVPVEDVQIFQQFKRANKQAMDNRTYSRGWTGRFVALFFLSLSALAAKEMRLGQVSAAITKPMEVVVNSLNFPDNKGRLRESYTGIAQLDFGLRFLVAAFLPGVAGWDKNFQIQQIYFLVSFFSIISIWSVEAGR